MSVTGKMVEAERRARKWTQAELAKRIGVGRTYVVAQENAATVSKKLLPKLDHAFGSSKWRVSAAPKPSHALSLSEVLNSPEEWTIPRLVAVLLDHEQRIEEIEAAEGHRGVIRLGSHAPHALRRRIRGLQN